MANVWWYLGPAGDLRRLAPMELDVEMTKTRYGGVFQGITGARTVDVTGFRDDYGFKFENIDGDEYAWMEALHTRHIPGPFWLINPMRRNRLSTRATTLDRPVRTNHGVTVSSGTLAKVYDWPSAAGIGAMSLRWAGHVANAYMNFDPDTRTPIFPGETITTSLWIKGAAATTAQIGGTWHLRDGTQTGTALAVNQLVTTAWTRISATGPAPDGALTFTAGVVITDTTQVNVAAPQVEGPGNGDIGHPGGLTAWEQGGAAPRVHVDQLTHTSHMYPNHSAELSLMEA